MTSFNRSQITFEQAEGVERMPSQMALQAVNRVLRARLWQAILSRVEREIADVGNRRMLGPLWLGLHRSFSVNRLGRFADDIGDYFEHLVATMRPVFEDGSYTEVLGLVEWLVRNSSDPRLAVALGKILEEERCAYRLVDGSIVPIASPEEGQALTDALATLKKPSLGGGRSHLLKAGSELTAGRYADSVRESIHAVESVARTLTGEASLQKALTTLSKDHPLHPALRNGFNSIYGYTSDANGIRHPMVGDDGAQVGEPEAIFMLGACASFVTFLIRLGDDGRKDGSR